MPFQPVTYGSFLFVALALACAGSSRGEPASAPAPRVEPRARATQASADVPDGRDTRLLEQPAVSATHVAFIYAGDLWVAGLDGGGARRLTTHAGLEMRPRFSPDGKWLAFTGEYDGNLDVYVLPVAGGEPRRLTWHPGADVVRDFTPDGKHVLFVSRREVHTNAFMQLFRVPVEGGFQERLPLPCCFKAAMSPDGKKIAYVPLAEAFNQWKNYRGGTVARIWIYDVGDRSVAEVPQPEGRCNDTDPMWLAGKLWFRSDRAGEFNLFSYDLATKAIAQHTRHADFPVQNAAAGGGRLVYEQAGWLHLLDPAATSTTRLAIGVQADLIETRERFVGLDADDDEQHVRSADVSPSGARAVFGFRGEIVTVPGEKGDPRVLTGTPGANERAPAWSPDGKSIAWISDASGENELVVAPQDGHGERKTFALGGAGFYDDLEWAPDGQKLSFVDNSRTLYWIELASGRVTRIDQEPLYGVFPTLHQAWSPDSRWIAYTRIERSHFRRAYLYEVAAGRAHAITDGLSDVSEPVFDAGGKYLYLTASTDAGPFNTWFSQASADIEETNALYLVVLTRDTPSPFARESDEEGAPEKSEKSEKGEDDAGSKEGEDDEAVPEVKIDLEGLAQRIVAFPLPAAFYSNLRAGPAGKLLYLKTPHRRFSGEEIASQAAALARFDLAEREEKVLLEGVQAFALAAKREKALLRMAAGWWIASVTGDKVDTEKGKLDVDAVQVKIDPRTEWRQIYDEAWRINRDYFYDPGMHGADWPAMKEKYARFLPHVAVRSDLTRVIRWMCSELAVGHHRTGGGETLVRSRSVPGGLLGADFEVAGERYRFKKVFGGLNWTPELRAPLTEPGSDVRAGEYLLAVNGVDLRTDEDVFARFENTADHRLELTVGPNADGSGSRVVQVVPVADESALRNRDWVEGNIRRVSEATGGRVAYVYVPDTADLGHLYFKRYFFPQADREALILDERGNGGGSVADYYIDILRRPYVSHWTMRYGEDLSTPQGAILGPKVMLIDESAGSGGDLLPWMFRKFGLGPLIGRPTWGGLVGVLGFPELMDGGSVTAPNIAFWTEEEGFGVENVGVPPDIEVEQLPALVADGHDPQLEKAIEVVLAQLAKNPPKKAVRPPFPVRVRK